jgi:exportin-2 (importin alpha re-exporter)
LFLLAFVTAPPLCASPPIPHSISRAAETYLKSVETQAGFPILLLQLVGTAGGDPTVCTAGAVFFKNYVKRNWAQSPDEANVVKITGSDRESIKTHLLALMLSAPASVQRQLAEVL